MRIKENFEISDLNDFKLKVLHWASNFNKCFLFDSNSTPSNKFNHPYQQYDFIAAAGSRDGFSLSDGDSIDSLDKFLSKQNDWYFGYLSYDLKNQIENLSSKNPDNLNWPLLKFVRPEYVFELNKKTLTISCLTNSGYLPKEVYNQIKNINFSNYPIEQSINIQARMTKGQYLNSVASLKEHIQRGDIYEVNFCQEFYAEYSVSPIYLYHNLGIISPSPFSTFVKDNDNFLISASPERYIKKERNKLITQPIKGTCQRGNSQLEDEVLVKKLRNNPKERSENIMIVDLVRNDLSRIAKPNTVKVEELCQIYPFPQVHQMISTISAELNDVSLSDILKATFPMGSMTGAPKIMAMKLAEKYETTKRGLYSGSVGYIAPNGDFDFNVVIRSLQYNQKAQYISYMVGSAITAPSDPEQEYNECLLKASAINKLLGKTTVYA